MAQLKSTEVIGDLNVNGDIKKDGKLIQEFIAEQNIKEIINSIYPKGSYYWTEDSTFDPNVKFGGTWAKVEDKMIMAKGTTFTDDGGNATGNITLTESQLPSHSHSISHTHDLTPEGELQNLSFKGTKTTTEGGGGHNHGLSSWNSYRNHQNYHYGFGYGSSRKAIMSVEENNVQYYTSNGGYDIIQGASDHSHSYTPSGTVSGSFKGNPTTTSSQNKTTSGPVGSGSEINIMPPYEVAYCWKRTA